MASMLTVAAYICQRYEQTYGQKIDEMKLHKLMYFAQREALIQTEKPLFRGTFHGWKYGPILKDIRDAYQDESLLPRVSQKDADAMEPIMDVVFREYAGKESMSLSRLTHGETSWKKSRKGIAPGENSDVAMKLADIRLDADRVRERREKLTEDGLL